MFNRILKFLFLSYLILFVDKIGAKNEVVQNEVTKALCDLTTVVREIPMKLFALSYKSFTTDIRTNL